MIVRCHGEETQIWDVTRRERVGTAGVIDPPDDHNWYMGRDLAWNATGEWLAAQHWSVTVWDVTARRLLVRLPRGRGAPTALAWDPAGKRLAVARDDGELVVWDVPRIRAQLDRIGLGW